MNKNPFEIFGLTPEMVGSLTEKSLFSVIKALYRALQKTVHPDVARRRKIKPDGIDQAVELNLAFEALNLDKDPAVFRRHRKNFVARRPQTAYKKSLTLARELARAEAQEERLASAYLGRLVTDYGWPKPDHPDALMNQPPPDAVRFPLRNLRLGLLDVAINQNLKMAAWSLGSNYKEINFGPEGEITIRPVGRSNFRRAAYIRLIGSVPAEKIELKPLLERPPARFFKTPALNASIGANGPPLSVLNRISPEQFKAHVLVHLQAAVSERSYLFSINRPEFEETGCLTLEGLVVKVNNYGETTAVGGAVSI